jgi:hypothetical protein
MVELLELREDLFIAPSVVREWIVIIEMVTPPVAVRVHASVFGISSHLDRIWHPVLVAILNLVVWIRVVPPIVVVR